MFVFQESKRHIDLLQKNHRHELGIERARHKETKQQLTELSQKLENVQYQLKVGLSLKMNLYKYRCWLFRESTDNLLIFANIKLFKKSKSFFINIYLADKDIRIHLIYSL